MKRAVLIHALLFGTIASPLTTSDSSVDIQELRTFYHLDEKYSDVSLSGKLVLVDFWASWCGPCRIQNQHLNQLYDTFHFSNFKSGKGLEIVSIALDKDSLRWQKAIRNDRLKWSVQVRDTAGFQSAFLKKYRVSFLPGNILLDSTGKVIARGLFGEALMEKLGQEIR